MLLAKLMAMGGEVPGIATKILFAGSLSELLNYGGKKIVVNSPAAGAPQ